MTSQVFAEMAGHQPAVGVVAAAGRRSDDEPDGLAFEIVVGVRGRRDQQAQDRQRH
jgi:hypothetical protein